VQEEVEAELPLKQLFLSSIPNTTTTTNLRKCCTANPG